MIKVTVQGKEYPSMIAACKALKMVESTIRARRMQGMSIEEAFTLPPKNCIYSKDHLGNVYRSFNAMCKAWKVDRDMVSYRLNSGWSIKKALTTKSQRDPNRWLR